MIVLITAIMITCNATRATTNSDDKDNNYNSIKRLLAALLIVILVTSQTPTEDGGKNNKGNQFKWNISRSGHLSLAPIKKASPLSLSVFRSWS